MGIETPDDAVWPPAAASRSTATASGSSSPPAASLGIRTVAGFLIGFPEDTEESIRRVRDYAARLSPTFANFNVVTPYPGTPMFEEVRERLDWADFSRFTVYTPVVQYEHLTAERIEWHVRKCFRRFYFRWEYLHRNARLLWPGLGRFAFGPFLK